MNADKLIDQIAQFPQQNILIIGDMVADIYLEGEISRISREAPVLVLIENNERTVPGGAANVIHNVATIGGNSYAVGVIGDDRGGENLLLALKKKRVYTDGVVVNPQIKTLTKTRIIAGGRATVSQQVVRIDRENDRPLSQAVEASLQNYLERYLPQMDAIVLSDYGSGTISASLREYLINYARTHDIPLMVDSRYNIREFKGATYIKQNDAELSAALKQNLQTTEDICKAAAEFVEMMQADGVLVTRGEDGMILYLKDGRFFNIPVYDKSEVFDVSGAGDTCVATFITAISSGLSPKEATILANFASGIAVRKMGTATVSAEELSATVRKFQGVLE